MSEIQACKLFADPNAMRQTESAIEDTTQQIHTAFETLEEADRQLHEELTGELAGAFQNALLSVESYIRKAEQTLFMTSQEMEHYTDQFMQINSNAEQQAGGAGK